MKYALVVLFWMAFVFLVFRATLRRSQSREEFWHARGDEVEFDDWREGSPDQEIPEDAKRMEF
jgi:hypothetical protein